VTKEYKAAKPRQKTQPGGGGGRLPLPAEPTTPRGAAARRHRGDEVTARCHPVTYALSPTGHSRCAAAPARTAPRRRAPAHPRPCCCRLPLTAGRRSALSSSRKELRLPTDVAALPEPPAGLSLLAAFKRGRERFPRRGERKGRHVVSKIMASEATVAYASQRSPASATLEHTDARTRACAPSRLILTPLLSGACMGLPLFISDATTET
jgi:hypothetical protein